jgi:hypothetical protein
VSQEGGGDWGLFGILGEGVIALKAVNVTGAQPDAPAFHVGSWWGILVLVTAGILSLCILRCIIDALCCGSGKK